MDKVYDYLLNSGIKEFIEQMAILMNSDIYQYIQSSDKSEKEEGNMSKFFKNKLKKKFKDENVEEFDEFVGNSIEDAIAKAMSETLSIEIVDKLDEVKEPNGHTLYLQKEGIKYIIYGWLSNESIFIPLGETDLDLLEEE